MDAKIANRLSSVEAIYAKGRSVEGIRGLNVELRDKKYRPLPEEVVREFLRASEHLPEGAKIILLDPKPAKIGGKLRVRWISRDDDGYTTLDGSIPEGFWVLAEPKSSWRANRWGR